MAKPVSEEELQLKKRARRRLIGAIALVAAVAAVLPMVLDSEPKSRSNQDINIQIPSPDAKGSAVTKAAPERIAKAAPEKSESKAPASTVPAPATAAKPASKAPENPNDAVLFPTGRAVQEKSTTKVPDKVAEQAPAKLSEKAMAKAPEKAPEKVVEKTAAPKAVPGTFFIQVIALSDAGKAKQVQQQVTDTGVRAYTEVVAAGTGTVTRVRAGPFTTRDDAEKARVKLQSAGIEGKVAAY